MVVKPGRSAAALLVECLATETCEYVFSVPGEETMDVLEALSEQTAVRHVVCVDELAAYAPCQVESTYGEPSARRQPRARQDHVVAVRHAWDAGRRAPALNRWHLESLPAQWEQ